MSKSITRMGGCSIQTCCSALPSHRCLFFAFSWPERGTESSRIFMNSLIVRRSNKRLSLSRAYRKGWIPLASDLLYKKVQMVGLCPKKESTAVIIES